MAPLSEFATRRFGGSAHPSHITDTCRILLLLLILTHTSSSGNFINPSQELPQPRAFHGTAVMGDYLYVFGGTVRNPDETEQPSPTVLKNRVSAVGTQNAWESTTPLPQPRHYIGNSTLVLNDVVYIVGGSSAPLNGDFYNTAIFSRPLPNGTLMPWMQSEPFGDTGLSTLTTVSTPGHIHIIGGLGQGDVPVADVWTNTIYSDGSMGAWTRGPSLPFPVWFHSAGVTSGRVYVWGGLPRYKSDAVSPYMLSAPILGSGKLGEWRIENAHLPKPFYSAASAIAGPYLMSFSPRYANGVISNDLWYCHITPNGPSAWSARQTTIPNKLYHAATADYRNGLIYLSGGRPDRSQTPRTETFHFELTPAARQLAENGWLQAQLAHLNTVSAIPALTQARQQVRLSYLADREISVSAVPGFKTYSVARDEATRSRVPLILYFNVSGSPPCDEQATRLTDAKFTQILPVASWAWVEARDYPQLAQQLGVYRVPTWVVYDKVGREVMESRRVGIQTAADLAKLVLPLR